MMTMPEPKFDVKTTDRIHIFIQVTGDVPASADYMVLPTDILEKLMQYDDTVNWREFFEAHR